MKAVPFTSLEPALFREIVRRALAEDLGWGDVTTEATVPGHLRARGGLIAKAACVLAGLDVAAETFRQLDPGVVVEARRRDGDACAAGDEIAVVAGSASSLLTAERTALNFLQRLSGIATLTRRYVDAAAGRITVLDTRKTTPSLRVLEKYAVRAGGATNHRLGLDDGMLIKDNHVRLAGGVGPALRAARAAGLEMQIEIEVQSLAQLREALGEGARFVMLDNFSSDDIREAVRLVAGRAKIEISGNVTLDRMADLADTGADYVSVGALTHSAPAADISFDIVPDRDAADGDRP